MSSIGQDECQCNQPFTSSSFAQRPQNRYLAHLLEEFEKCTLQTGGLAKLQKEHQQAKIDIQDAQNDIKDLKSKTNVQTDKINELQRDVQQQRLIQVQLRDEIANEFRTLYRKVGNQDRDIELMKQQIRTNSKKITMELENLQWDLSTKHRMEDYYTSYQPDEGNTSKK